MLIMKKLQNNCCFCDRQEKLFALSYCKMNADREIYHYLRSIVTLETNHKGDGTGTRVLSA